MTQHAYPGPYDKPRPDPYEAPPIVYDENATYPGPYVTERNALTGPEPVAPLSPSGMLMSLTGFDEIAVTMHFGQKIGTLREEDSITLGRALAFIHYRRNGERDKDAYELAMNLPIEGVTTFFQPEPEKTPTAEEAEAATTDAQDMAAWVIATGIAPSEYKALTIGERNALTEEHNRVVTLMESRGR